MKWLIPLSLCLFFLSTSFANTQDSSKTVALITYLSKGESLNYAVTKTRIDSTGGKETKRTDAKFNFKITVVDSTDSSYIFSYYKTMNFLDNENLQRYPEELQKQLISLSQLKIDYETNEVGAFKKILNEEEIMDKYHKDLEELKQLSADEKIAEIFDGIISKIDPKTILSTYSQDILALHYALGLEFDIADTIELEEEIVAPLFNVPIQSYGIFYCDTYDPENDYISFSEEKVIDENFTEKIIDIMKKFENKDNPIPKEELLNMKMDLYLYNNYQYNTAYGVPIFIALNKVITVSNDKENLKRIEMYEISIEE